MSNFDPNSSRDHSGRAQAERKQIQLLSDLSKSLDTQHHNTSLMHEFGSAFDSPETVSGSTSGTGTVGSAPGPARSDHQHGAEVPTFILPVGLNGWANYGGGWLGARYYKLGGRVYIDGLVAGGTMGANIFLLQAGYRPLGNIMFSTICGNVLGRINVMVDGSVYFEPAVGSNAYCSLECSFLPGI
jgi:hypothetical protein